MHALSRMLDHLRWADEVTFAALRAAKSAPEVVLERFMHVIAAEHVWLARLRHEPPRVGVWPKFTFDGCASLMAANHREFAALLAAGDGDPFARTLDYTSTQGAPFANSVGDILLHVALHGAWHRGQIAALMRQAGLEPAPSDYILFARGTAANRGGRG
jgi:uncharacterized damage-inducible protein DinB